MKKPIDSLEQLDLHNLKLLDIASLYRTFRVETEGRGRGRKIKTRTGLMTNLGDIETSVWLSAIEICSQNAKEQYLLEAMVEWYKELRFFSSDKDNIIYAHDLYCERFFDRDDWADYIPFNQKYRPEYLKNR